MEQLRRMREPIALVLLVAAGLRLLMGIAAVPLLASRDAYGRLDTAALFEAARTFDVVLALAAAVVAASCLLPPATRRARGLVTLAVIEVLAGVLVALAFGLMGLSSNSAGRAVEVGYLLFGMVVPVLVVVALLTLLRVPAAVTEPIPPPAVVADPAPPAAPPGLPAAWQPEQATGRVWSSAEEAARGAPGTDWPDGGAGGGAGWQPIPGPVEPPPDPPRR